ncbi:MAG TPA: hypothetical protein VK673_15945, partial [Chthoniobacterales bacterium]|nr:hypothetical protein [Chthoniobacterales bacterium]
FSGPRPFALLEFIEGTLLSDSLGSLDGADLIGVAFEAGISLQAIHSLAKKKLPSPFARRSR